jgi:PAS domain S-box-containing protein
MAVRYNQMFTATTGQVDHTIHVLSEDQQALSALYGAETGSLDSIVALRRHLENLRPLVADNPLQLKRVDSLLALGLRWSGPGAADRLLVGNTRGGLLRLQVEEGRLLNAREAANTKNRKQLKDAILALLALTFTLVGAGAWLIAYHFSRRKKAEQGLRESRDLVGLLVDHVRDFAIFMVDPEGIILSWNQGAEQIKGYKTEEILGKPISLFYTDEENIRGEPGHNLRQAEKEGRYECIGLRKRKDGSVFYADVVFTAMRDEKGKLTGFIKITKDITVQMKVREDLSKALARERELNEMKSRFVTLASHEFKTPLSVILSSTNLIEKYQDEASADKRLRHIQRIKSNVNNLKQLLNDFLSLEKLEEGVVRNEPVRTDLVKLAEEAIQDMEEACKDGQRVDLQTKGNAGEILVDQQLLRNVLINLLSNAIKYSPGGGIVRFGLEFRPDQVIFVVADQGIGIPEEEQEHLFERFFRAKNTSGISGTGLGLSIVKKYLDLMGGDITVESRSGNGSTFTIVLPVKPVFRDEVHPIR